MTPKSMLCGVKRIPCGEYKGYKITKIIQTDIDTGEPLNNGCDWYSLYNEQFDDRIGTQHESDIPHTIDYRLRANPRKFGSLVG